MKKIMRERFSRLLAACIVLAGVVCLMHPCAAIAVQKAEEEYSLELPRLFWMGQGEEELFLRDAEGYDVYTDSLTMSKNGIFEVYGQKFLDEDDNEHYEYSIEPLKPGKTKMTLTFKKSDGTIGSFSTDLEVKEYPKQIKSLYVNGKKVRIRKNVKSWGMGKVDQRYEYYVRNKKTSGRIRFVPSKGWEISEVDSTVTTGDSYRDFSKKITKKMIRKGKSFPFPRMWDMLEVYITAKNRKGETISYLVCMHRDGVY